MWAGVSSLRIGAGGVGSGCSTLPQLQPGSQNLIHYTLHLKPRDLEHLDFLNSTDNLHSTA